MMVLPRILEPEVMESPEEARDYNRMDHRAVNRCFVDDFLVAWENPPGNAVPNLVLDVGTGTALIPIELCQRSKDWHVVADDLSREMLVVAKENVQRVGLEARIMLRHVDSKRILDADETYPAVFSNSIVHHIPEPRRVFAEMWRVLKPSGMLFVRDLLRPETTQQLDELVQKHAGEANPHQRQMFRDSLHAALTLAELRSLLLELKIPIEQLQATSDRHWTLVATKT